MKGSFLVLCFSVAVVTAEDSVDEDIQRIAYKVLNDCLVTEDFSVCLKTKAVVFLERLRRMKHFSLVDGVSIVRSPDVPETNSNITEEQLDKVLPRSIDDRKDVLNQMLMEKLGSYLSSRTVELSTPRTFEEEEEEVHHESGGGKKKRKTDHSKLIMLLFGAKASALAATILAATFLIAQKALIIGKIALIISAIIGLRKFLIPKPAASIQYEQGNAGHDWDHDWYGGGGGRWRKTTNGQDLPYSGYSPK